MEHLFLFCRSTAAEFVTSNSVLPLSPLDLNPPPHFPDARGLPQLCCFRCAWSLLLALHCLPLFSGIDHHSATSFPPVFVCDSFSFPTNAAADETFDQITLRGIGHYELNKNPKQIGRP